MFLSYDIKYGKLYAKLVKSTRQGATVHKDYIYLGLVLDKEQGIYKNRKNGIFKYDVATNTYDYNPKWEGDVAEAVHQTIESGPKKEKKSASSRKKNIRDLERARINKLNMILLENNRYDDLRRSFSDEDFQMQLLDELV